MTDTPPPKRKRRMAREPKLEQNDAATKLAPAAKTPSKLDQIESMLLRENGASVSEMVTATAWQQHSVRGAMAGALKKRGLTIHSEKIDGVRRYRAERPA